MSNLLEIKNVNKIFSGNKIIDNVSLNIGYNEFVTFLGPSGCGKTTLLRMIAGFYNCDGGEILLEGRRIDKLAPQHRNTPMVFQEYALFPHLSVYENIAYGLKIKKISKEDIRKKVLDTMALLNLDGMENRFPNQMSGGQQQRVAIARAMVNDAKLILLDEPLSNLDAKLRENVRVELRQLQKKLKITMIYVTHDQQEALSMSDKIVVLKGGVIMEIGSPRQMYYEPYNKFVSQFIGTTNFIDADYALADELFGEIKSDESISVRPESITLNKEKLEDYINIPCEILYSTFLGEKVRYFVKDKYNKEWIVDEFDIGNIEKSGLNFYLSFRAAKARKVFDKKLAQ